MRKGNSDLGNATIASQDRQKTANAAAQMAAVTHITAVNKAFYCGAQSKTPLPKSNYNPDDMQRISE